LKIDPDISCKLDALTNEFKRWIQRIINTEEKQTKMALWVKEFSEIFKGMQEEVC
jgi:hypothetical protein